MADASSFSPDYIAARARFRSSALALGCELEEHPIDAVGPDGEALTIDLARMGTGRPQRAVVVSSGLHGVEGYLGSAVQAALMEEALGGWTPPPGGALVLLHALNPYGYAWTRRVNEDNADLNRNFLGAGEAFEGTPDGYAALDGLLNPRTPPPRVDAFMAVAAWHIARQGMGPLKDAVAGGQYDYPEGLFYGGSRPSATQRVLARVLPRWVGSAERVLHVDFHTGLGEWGTYKLIVDRDPDSEGFAWLARHFGAEHVQAWTPEDAGVSYHVRGGMGAWCKELLPGAEYDVLAAEFGTYNAIKVLAALRAENRAHQWGRPDDPATRRAKHALKGVFAPGHRGWRDHTVQQGLEVVRRALEVCLE